MQTFSTPATPDLCLASDRRCPTNLSDSCGLSASGCSGRPRGASVSTMTSVVDAHEPLPLLRKCDPCKHHHVVVARYPGAECYAVQRCELVADACGTTLRVAVVRTSGMDDDDCDSDSESDGHDDDDDDDSAGSAEAHVAEVHELPLDGRVEVDAADDYPATLGCGCSLFCITSSATMDEYWFAVDGAAKTAWGDALYATEEPLYIPESMLSVEE